MRVPRPLRRPLVACIALVALLGAISALFLRETPPRYTIAEIMPLPNFKDVCPSDINNRGQVVGTIKVEGRRGQLNAFIWDATRGMTDLGVTVGKNVLGSAQINDEGQIAIPSVIPNPAVELWNGNRILLRSPTGELTDLGGRNSSERILLNNSGEMVFVREEQNVPEIVFRDCMGECLTIEEGEFSPSILLEDLNDRGHLLFGKTRAEGGWEAHVWDRRHGARAVEAPVEGDRWFSGRRLNDGGQIVGMVVQATGRSSPFEFYPYILSDGKLIELGTLGGMETKPNEINNLGQVIGDSGTSGARLLRFVRGLIPHKNKRLHAAWKDIEERCFERALHESRQGAPFLWEEGRMWKIDDLIPDDSGWLLSDAIAINDRGQIVGSGVHNGRSAAFLLTPEP